jgi:hypothetical protein
MSLSVAGLLSDGGAAAGTSTVTFGYNEPGALPTFTLHSGNVSGTLPWMGTVYPAEGAVPSGMSLSSPDDTSMRATVLSTWPDGSAQVMVVAGHKTGILANSTTTVRVRPAIVSDTPMTTSNLIAIVGTVAVNFGTPLSLTLTANNHDRVWWANSQVICARYRLPITNKGVMEAVIDVHAFANGRAFVEVVIENSRMTTASPSAPVSQTYTNATVSVNGSVIATQSVPNITIGSYTFTTHEAFRSWYCSGWIGGDPLIDVTHDAPYLQAHPAFFRIDQPPGSMAAYASDVYEPWSTERQRSAGMGGGGDHGSIGPLPAWECHYLQSGSKDARKAVLASTLAVLTYNVNYRDINTNKVPTHSQLLGKSHQFNFPATYNSADAWSWEVAHHPASGLMAFLCRPSPCFIEIAQKISVWNALYDYSASGLFTEYYQVRGIAWCFRSLAHATFLTPDGDAWKTASRTSLASNVSYLTTFYKDISATHMSYMYEASRDAGFRYYDIRSDFPGTQSASWFTHYVITEMHKSASMKVLTGADQTALNTFADWICLQPVKYVNEALGTEWRYVPYVDCVGKMNGGSNVSPDPEPTWGLTLQWYHQQLGETSTPNGAGTWFSTPTSPHRRPRYDEVGAGPIGNPGSYWLQDTVAGSFYPSYFCAALAAAVERGVSGADAAWNTVVANITNWSTWRGGFASNPRWGAYPRNK